MTMEEIKIKDSGVKLMEENHYSPEKESVLTDNLVDKRKKKEVQWLDNIVSAPVKSSCSSVSSQKEISIQSTVKPVTKEKFQMLRERFMEAHRVGSHSETYERKMSESSWSQSIETKEDDKLETERISPDSVFHPNAVKKEHVMSISNNNGNVIKEPYFGAKEYFQNKSSAKPVKEMGTSYTSQATLPVSRLKEKIDNKYSQENEKHFQPKYSSFNQQVEKEKSGNSYYEQSTDVKTPLLVTHREANEKLKTSDSVPPLIIETYDRELRRRPIGNTKTQKKRSTPLFLFGECLIEVLSFF